jgi:hypothetical protein
MGLFDIFSGDAGTAAAARSKDAANKGLKKAGKQLKKFNKKARREYREGEYEAKQDLTAGKTEGLGYIDTGTDKAVAALNQGQGYYQPLAERANAAFGRYDDIFGGGGQEGYDRAASDWENSLYKKSMTGEGALGVQAINRQSAARGNPYNATDLMEYDDQLAGKWIPQYTSDMWRVAGMAPEIAGAQAGLNRDIAGVYGQQGVNKAGIATGTAGRLADTGMWGASGAAGTLTNTGNQLSNLAMQQGQNNAQYYQNAYGAQQGANQNLWNGILGVAGMGTQLGSAYLGKA